MVNVTRPWDGGEYTCLVSNGAGNDTNTTMLYITPWIVTEPADVLTRDGMNESLTCEAEGFPDPDYQWQHFQSADVSSLVSTDPVFSFRPVEFGDEGLYQCVAYSDPTGGMNLTAESRNTTLTGK